MRTLAAIDEALGIGDDGCGDPDQTLTAIDDLKAAAQRGEALALTVMGDQTSHDHNETAQPAPVGQVERGVRPGAEALHAAVCQAVALLNRAPEVARCAEGREARDLLRQALVAYADAYMDEPATERERASVAAKHQRKPRVSTAAELRQQAKSDTSCVGAFARARPGKA